MKQDEDKRSEEQAKAQLESIKEMVARLQHAQECDGKCELDDTTILSGLGYSPRVATDQEREEYHERESAEQAIHQDPLSVEVRTGWYCPGSQDSDTKPAEYRILLCTGGPACQIVGDLNEYGEPETARIEHQDWFTPWIEYQISHEEEEIVLQYVRCFYFGE